MRNTKKDTMSKNNLRKPSARKAAGPFYANAEFSNANIKTCARSAAVAGVCLKVMGEEMSLYTRKSLELSFAAIRDIMASKSIPEAFDRQSSFAKMSRGAYVSQVCLLNSFCVATMQHTLAPFQARADAIARA